MPTFTPSLFSKDPEIPWKQSLTSFAKTYNAYVKCKSPGSNILIGYSLGGRLALHALIEEETLYKGAIIISTHTGLKSTEERSQRLKDDETWANRLKETSFQTFTEKWDQLPLFEGSPKLIRDEAQFDTHALVHGLTAWSLGNQEDLQKEVEALKVPLLFMAGERDAKFCKLASSLSLKNPCSKFQIVKETNHRVPWQSQEIFIEVVKQFIKSQEVLL